MIEQDFKNMVFDITKKLKNKTILGASCSEWGMSYSITIYFTDGTNVEITPEHDEGFVFNFEN